MERNLREHFEQAVSDDPGFALGDLAQAAMVEGGQIRRNRRTRLAVPAVAAGVVAVIGAVAGLNLLPEPAEPQATIAAAMMPVSAPSCQEKPVETGATDAAVFLGHGTTDRQRTRLLATLEDDPRIAAVAFESREEAYQKFRIRWAKDPDFLAAVDVGSFPESIRLRLKTPEQYTAFRSEYVTADGVNSIVGRRCSADAPVGGTL
ncbi:permease-like cell division protein FtsX [Actinoplanes aureus]|uniref:FtsX extracellular domain-containing protein n=1 Tax=Actinoplanes aureus TaxID=2792083 RepID=A0A931G2M6_9ACTN|nr:permease-like cell division protein FtsX [Actinoplanes aureus]MBG0568335.1 hypothetical protein [Actinoplanes aureus]